jgi:hypothetical protein
MKATLRSVPTLDETLRLACIAAAEDLLAKAKAGQMTGFVALLDHPGNEWSLVQTQCHDRIALVGKLTIAATRIANNLFDG